MDAHFFIFMIWGKIPRLKIAMLDSLLIGAGHLDPLCNADFYKCAYHIFIAVFNKFRNEETAENKIPLGENNVIFAYFNHGRGWS